MHVLHKKTTYRGHSTSVSAIKDVLTCKSFRPNDLVIGFEDSLDALLRYAPARQTDETG